ncbi:cytochrome-c peroxidase [Tropicimonas sp. IMCC34043]|uniref:cytochrome-c peroxidase n=1 Tax=Tropicimonas sp. IMCC34043 TaxID=2248760 RepID=UPI000E260DD4|nr:cytochrome-c peroxidase [Tropicimonas sp. IMCC34043]
MRHLGYAIAAFAAGAGAAVAAEDPAALREEAIAIFEPIPETPDPAPDAARVELGKMLYFEPRLSEGHNISCNTCHNLGTGGADLARVSLGHRWQEGGRNSPTVLNSVYNLAQFWDGRAADLQAQAGGPMVNPVEMGSTPEHVVEQLKGIPGYEAYFAAAFPGDDPLTFENATSAIAAFEDTLITPDAPFDLFLKGDDTAMNAEQMAGLRTFIDSGCVACHNGINVGGDSYQPFGVMAAPDAAVLPPDDKGRFAVTRTEGDEYVFKVPTLRNIVLTPPYFHSGSVWDLNDAVAIMGTAQLGEELDDAQVGQIVAFLGALTGRMPQVIYPTLPPSTADTPRPQP